MQLANFVVTDIGAGTHVSVRVAYGPYNTICKPQDVWSVKKQLKLLPVMCPACKREIYGIGNV